MEETNFLQLKDSNIGVVLYSELKLFSRISYILTAHDTIITEINEPQKEPTYHLWHRCILSNKRKKKSNLQEGSNICSALSHRITTWVDFICFWSICLSLINDISDLFLWLSVITAGFLISCFTWMSPCIVLKIACLIFIKSTVTKSSEQFSEQQK